MAIEKDIIINVEDRDALASIGKVDKSLEKLDDTANQTVTTANVGLSRIGKSSIQGSKGVIRVSSAFKSLAIAMKAAGIGLVIGALTTLKEVFTSNQKVADLLSTAFETISLVFNSFVETVVEVAEKVTEATGGFDALKKVVGGLLTIAITPLKLAFFGIKLGLQEAQLAWEQSFFGDKDPTTIKELNAAIKETRNDLADVAIEAVDAGKQVADNFVEAVGEVTTLVNESIDGVSEISVSAAYEAAKANVELKNTAKLAAAQQGLLVEKYDLQAEKLRQIRDEERNSIAERKKANDDLLKVLADQEKAMLAQASAQVAAAQAEVDKNNSIENQVALTEALANKQGVLAQVEGFRSEQKSNDLALDREQIELTNAKAESESKLSIERKRFNAEQIEDELLRLEKLKEIDILEAEQEAIRLQAIVDNANAGTQAKVDAEIALDEFKEQSRQTNLERDKEIAEQEKKINDAKIDIDTKTAQTKIQNAQNVSGSIGQLATLAGESTAAGKALGVASATIDTYVGANKAIAKGGFAGTLQAIAIIATGLANVKNIISTKIPQTKVGTSTSTSGGSTVAAPQVPNFNIVGATETSQLADAIGEQTQQPVQAYVVANDVTTAQSLNNNIVEGASIG
jgi:hypothetical protein